MCPGRSNAGEREGLEIGIFSSGSVLAQQLLFRHSTAGDLTGYLRWHFDTTIGAKMEADSYRRIAAAMAIPPQAVLFISDACGSSMRPARRACRRACQSGLATRPPDNHGHIPLVPTFDELV